MLIRESMQGSPLLEPTEVIDSGDRGFETLSLNSPTDTPFPSWGMTYPRILIPVNHSWPIFSHSLLKVVWPWSNHYNQCIFLVLFSLMLPLGSFVLVHDWWQFTSLNKQQLLCFPQMMVYPVLECFSVLPVKYGHVFGLFIDTVPDTSIYGSIHKPCDCPLMSSTMMKHH